MQLVRLTPPLYAHSTSGARARRAAFAVAMAAALAAGAAGAAGCEDASDPEVDGATDTPEPDVAEPDVAEPDVPAVDDVPDVGPGDAEDTVADAPDDASDASEPDVEPELPPADADIPDVDDVADVEPDTAPDVVEPPPAVEPFDLACGDDSDCEVSCAAGVCVDGECAFETSLLGCVVTLDAEAGQGACVAPWGAHPDQPCLVCSPSVSTTEFRSTILDLDFEVGVAAGLTATNLSGSAAEWTVQEGRASSGVRSLYFGDPATLTYDVNGRAWGRAETLAIDVPEGVSPTLSFSLWLDTEETPAYDFLRVLAFVDGAALPLWHSDALGGTTGGEFLPVEVTLEGYGGQEVSFAFEFDTVDGIINAYEGAYIDEVRLTLGCCAVDGDCASPDACVATACGGFGQACEVSAVEACCNVDGDCDDGDPCTLDSCSGPGGGCSHTPIDGCCETASDCDDKDACTLNTCVDSQCSVTSLCCEQAADCVDDDPCTEATCVGGACQFSNTCCLSDGMCNDGDYCTNDFCIGGECTYTFANFPGCCNANADCNDGNPCTKDSCNKSVGTCNAVPIEGCCLTVDDCDDGNPSTVDACITNKCSNCGDGVCQDGENCEFCDDCPCEMDGSCFNKCGDFSSGSCGCDSSCAIFGDCCPDACSYCGFCGG